MYCLCSHHNDNEKNYNNKLADKKTKKCYCFVIVCNFLKNKCYEANTYARNVVEVGCLKNVKHK